MKWLGSKNKFILIFSFLTLFILISNGSVQATVNVDSTELLELKEIEEVILYKRTNDSFEEVDELVVAGFNADDYLAKIVSPVFNELYLNVNELIVEDNEVFLMLDYNHSVTYEADEKLLGTKVRYGTLTNGIVKNLDFETIIEMIKEDPTQDITLTNDLDFLELGTIGTYVFDGTYSGTFDGNGYTIENLDRTLFQYIEGTVKNLHLTNANISTLNSILAFTIEDALIENVHISDSKINRLGKGLVGAFSPIAKGETTIKNSSVLNTDIAGGLRTGGFVGGVYNNFTVENSIFNGTISNNSNRVGGMIGQIYNGTTSITNSYVDFELIVPNADSTGGFIGYNAATATLNQSVSLATGDVGYRYFGAGSYNITNGYEIAESTLTANSRTGLTEISKTALDASFFFETLLWDSSIWEYNDHASLPVLKLDTQIEESSYEELKIPNYEFISEQLTFDTARQLAYQNAFKLMPFYDSEFILAQANELSVEHLFNQQSIVNIYPLDASGDIVYGLNDEQPDEVKTLMIEFANEQQVFDVTYVKTFEGVAIYQFDDLPLRYNFGKFVLDLEHSKYDEIMSLVEEIDYLDDLEPLTTEVESRLMRDWYNEQVKPNLEEMILEVIESTPKYNNYEQSANHEDFIMSDLNSDNQLEKMLYTLNYFDRYYNVEMGMSQLSDMFILGGQTYYNDVMSLDYLIDKIMSTTFKDEREYVAFYNVNIAPLTGGMTIRNFLEDRILTLTDYETPEDWFTSEIGSKIGQFRELGIDDLPEAEYRGWTLINRRDFLVLPIISATDEVLADFYLATTPAQIILGSLSRYQAHLDNDPAFDALFDEYSTYWLNYVKTPSNWTTDPVKALNGKTTIHYDTRKAYPNAGDQHPELTEIPVLKWFYDEWNTWPADNGSGAYANGTDAWYVRTSILGSGDKSIATMTHEAAHNLDGFYFYGGIGRRVGSRAEDHADGNYAQYSNNKAYSFNLIRDAQLTAPVFSNFTMERIDTEEKIEDFYHDGFDTIYVLDYLIGQAFLSLSPLEQSLVSTQAQENGSSTTYSRLTVSDFEQMKLGSIDDLYDNKLTLLRPHTMGTNNYSQPTHLDVYWYQPFNEAGRADGNTFKRMGFEFLGEAGYQDGYVTYMSRKATDDLDALKQMTEDENMTYELYKKGRFNEVAQHVDALTYFDADGLVEVFSEALRFAAQTGDMASINNAKQTAYGIVKRATEDFTVGTVYEQSSNIQTISTAEQFLSVIENNTAGMGSYQLVADLDFTTIESEDVAYVMDTFIGYIDGNGYTITGLTKPLFNEIHYSYIKNLTFENVEFSSENGGLIALTAYYSGVENITAHNLEGVNQLFETDTTTIEVGNISVQSHKKVTTIYSVEEFLAMEADREYKLMRNLDFSSVNKTSPYIANTFTGTLDGNGLTISNTSQPLFNELSGTVKNLTINDVEITSTVDYMAAIAKTSKYATIHNIRGNNIAVSGRHNVAALIAQPSFTMIDNVDLTNINITGTGVYVGGISGRAFTSNISNVYVHGQLSISTTATGGVVGALRNSSTVSNVFANVDVVKTSNGNTSNANAAFVGMFESANGSVRNSIVYGNASNATEDVTGVYKTIWAEDPNNNKTLLANVYEVEETTGMSSITETSNIIGISQHDLSSAFYVNSLGWSEDVWNLSGDVPRLKGVTIDQTNESNASRLISSVEDLLAIEYLDANYELTANIDLSNVTSSTPIIEGTFTGIFEGNGFIVSNSTQPLFETLSGSVKNLNINDVNIDSGSTGDSFGALAKTSDHATLYNIRANNISVKGKYRIAALIGAALNTTMDIISVTNVDISAEGPYVGGLIGRAFTSNISNIYIDGVVSFKDTANGGVIGAVRQSTHLSNVLANVETIRLMNGDTRDANGGIIGHFETSNGSLTNSVAFSNAMNPTESITGTYKVLWAADPNNNTTRISNVFELEESSGMTSITDASGIKSISSTDLDLDFYLNTLGWSEDVWDLYREVPVLWERDELDNPIMDTIVILTVDDLLNIENEGLDKEYILGADLDLSGIDEGTSIISGTFTGIFNGNGYTLRNLSLPLFNTLSGEIKHVTLEDVSINPGSNADSYGAVAKVANHATAYNLRLDNVSVTGKYRIASVFGSASHTTVDNVEVLNVSITATGPYVGGVIGRAFSSTISNIYAQGTVTFSDTANGGVIGAVNDETTVSNVFANIETHRTRNGDTRNYNAGIIGHFEEADSLLTTSVAYANAMAETDTITGTYKAVWNENANQTEKVYEVSETTGKTSVTEEGHVTTISKLDMNHTFYTETLAWSEDVWDFSGVKPRLHERDTEGNAIISEVEVIEIHTVEDLLSINTGLGLAKDYKLMADLDLSEITDGDSIILKIFTGSFDGYGYTLRNLSLPLFNTLSGEIKNVTLEDVSINPGSNADSYGAVAKVANHATAYNLRLDNVSVTGKYRIASVFGSASHTTVDNVEVLNVSITATGPYVGGVIGRAFSSTISNIYAQGTVTFSDTANGGVIGAVNDETTVSNVFANIETHRTRNGDTRNYNAGIIGHFEEADSLLTTSVAYGNAMAETDSITGTYKAVWNENADQTDKVYEVSETTGKTSVTDDGFVTAMSKMDMDRRFYIDTLGWSSDVWRFSGTVPRLYDRDEQGNAIISEVEVNEIHTVDDLLDIFTALGLVGNHVLMANIDLSEVIVTEPYIDATFTGTLEGNGYTISNMNQPLFNKLSGVVHNIGIENVNIDSGSTGDNFGSLAKTSENAEIYNVRANNISLTGKYRIAGLVGSMTNTIVDKVELTNVIITAEGPYVGGLTGRAFSSTISNVYVEGTISFNDTANGGVIGAVRDNTTVTHVFSNAKTIRLTNGDTRQANGGLIGHFETTNTTLTNSVAYADAMDPTETITGTYKAVWSENANQTENVYEALEATGLSSVTEQGHIIAKSRSEMNQDFYVFTLGFSPDVWDFSSTIPKLIIE